LLAHPISSLETHGLFWVIASNTDFASAPILENAQLGVLRRVDDMPFHCSSAVHSLKNLAKS